MKNVLYVGLIVLGTLSMSSCGGETKTENAIDNVDSTADAKKDSVDISADAKKDSVDISADAKKDSVDVSAEAKKDSLNH